MSSYAAARLLKQQIPLLDYLVSQHWQPARRIARGRLMGQLGDCNVTHPAVQPDLVIDEYHGSIFTRETLGKLVWKHRPSSKTTHGGFGFAEIAKTRLTP